MYLTYTEYTGMGGTLTETVFNQFSAEAEAEIDYVTFNRFTDDTTYPTKLKNLVFHLIALMESKCKALSNTDSNGDTLIAKQSNDGVAVEYIANAVDIVVKSCSSEISQSIRKYLSGVKNEAGLLVLYRGLYCGE